MPQRELSDLKGQSITGRRHRLNELNLEDIVDIDLAVEGHLRFVGTVSSRVLHSDGDEPSAGIGTSSLKNVQFLDLSKGQQEWLKFRGLRKEQQGQVLNQQSRSYRDGYNERRGPL